MSTVATRTGKFVWHEQVSDDPKQAESFYTQLFGWGTEVFKAQGMDYTMISSGGRVWRSTAASTSGPASGATTARTVSCAATLLA